MLLHLMTWKEVETYLKRSKGIIIPIGSTEQHGPSGVIGTDAICAEIIARSAGEIADAIVGPTINVGMSLHHLSFPGSISLRPSTLMAVIMDYTVSLAKSGFRRFFFINGHGGNVATANAAFSEIYDRLAYVLRDEPKGKKGAALSGNNTRMKLICWYDAAGAKEIVEKQFGNEEGQHATPGEVSVTQYAYPEAVRNVGKMEKAVEGLHIYSADDFRARYPDGRIGSNPSLSSPEVGQVLVDIASREISEIYLDFLNAE